MEDRKDGAGESLCVCVRAWLDRMIMDLFFISIRPFAGSIYMGKGDYPGRKKGGGGKGGD